MRIRDPPPPVVMLSDYGGEVGSSMSETEPSSLPPQPKIGRNYKSLKIPRAGQAATRKRVLQRSPQLQSALHRMEIRSASPSSPWTREGVDRDPVDQVQDIFFTYDVVLDHLVRKNRDLKAYVRNQSRHFPSEQSYTSTEVIDALEMLRMERETSLQPRLDRRAISQPRPSRMSDSIPHHTFYESQHEYSRNRIGSSFTDQRRVGTDRGYQQDQDLLKRVNFMCDRLTQGNKGHQHHIDKRDEEGTYDYRRQSREVLQVMNEFKANDTDQIRENLPRERPLSIRRGIRRDDPVTYFPRPSIGAHSGGAYRDRRVSGELPGRERTLRPRFDDSDPIEILRSRGDRVYEHFDLHPREPVYDPYEKSSLVASEREDYHTNSKILSKLLPEKIPPKIQASRERLFQFRNSRLKRMTNEELDCKDRQSIAYRQMPLPPLHRRLDTRQLETPYTIRSPGRYMSPRTVMRPESPEAPRDVIDVEAYYRPPDAHHIRNNRFVHSTSNDPVEHYRDELTPSDSQDGDSSGDPSMTPSEKARQLISHVNDVYRLSKEMRESNERIEEELTRIKELYLRRSRALEFPSTSKDLQKESVTSDKPDTRQNLTRRESSPQRHVIRPPRFSLDKMKKSVSRRKSALNSKRTKATDKSGADSDEPVIDSPSDKERRLKKSSKKRTVVDRHVQLYDRSLISCSSGESTSHVREEKQITVSRQNSNDNEESDFELEPLQVSRAKKALSENLLVLPEQQGRGGCCT